MSPTLARRTSSAPAARPMPRLTTWSAAPTRLARPRIRCTSSSAVRPSTDAGSRVRAAAAVRAPRAASCSGRAARRSAAAASCRDRRPTSRRRRRAGPAIHLAEERERAILDEQHAAAAAQVEQRRHRLRPADVVNDVEHVRVVQRAQPFHRLRIHLHLAVDGAVVNPGAGGAHRQDLVAAVVVGREHRQPRVSARPAP